MSNNPMKKTKRTLSTITKMVNIGMGTMIKVPLRKGEPNWRVLAGQKVGSAFTRLPRGVCING